jgi:hypothetical protein
MLLVVALFMIVRLPTVVIIVYASIGWSQGDSLTISARIGLVFSCGLKSSKSSGTACHTLAVLFAAAFHTLLCLNDLRIMTLFARPLLHPSKAFHLRVKQALFRKDLDVFHFSYHFHWRVKRWKKGKLSTRRPSFRPPSGSGG